MNNSNNGLPPKPQLSAYEPAPETYHGSDNLPNPPQRGPEVTGRYLDSAMAASSAPKIKIPALVQVLLALVVVAIVSVGVFVWFKVTGKPTDLESASSPSYSFSPDSAVPGSGSSDSSASAQPSRDPSAPSGGDTTEGAEGGKFIKPSEELKNAISPELREQLGIFCHNDSHLIRYFSGDNEIVSKTSSCVVEGNEYMVESVAYVGDSNQLKVLASPYYLLQPVDLGVSSAPGHEVKAYGLLGDSSSLHIVDMRDDHAVVYVFYYDASRAADFLVAEGVAQR